MFDVHYWLVLVISLCKDNETFLNNSFFLIIFYLKGRKSSHTHARGGAKSGGNGR